MKKVPASLRFNLSLQRTASPTAELKRSASCLQPKRFLLRTSRFLIAATIASVSLYATAQNVPLEEAAFTDFVAQTLKREVGETAVSVKGPLTVSVGPLQANLDRIYGFCRVNTGACASEIDRYAKGAAQVLKQQSAPLDKDAVRVVIRSNEYIKRAQASLGSDGPTLQARPLVDGLVSVAVLDTPRAIRPMDDRDLKKLAMSQEQLFELGGSNLVANLKPIAEVAKPVGTGQIGTVAGSIFEVGRVALPAQWAPLASAQQGTLLIALPTTDLVLYVSEATPLAIDALRALAKSTAAKASNPLAATAILKWSSDRWELVP